MKPFQQGNLQDWKYLSRSRVNHVYVVAIADVYVVAIVDVYALSINEGWMH